MDNVEASLNYVGAIADWLLDLGDAHLRRGELEEVLKYMRAASEILSQQNRDLVSARIETNFRVVAKLLADQGILEKNPLKRVGRPETCLHVMSEALPAGGHTAMAHRWIRLDSERIHSVALLAQNTPVPRLLRDAVDSSGGKIYLVDPTSSFVNRAAWLRQLTSQEADYVILHIDTGDVICGVAFGIPGGPPTILVNHAAHIYWNGISTVDQIANCRGSELELRWSSAYRGAGATRNSIIPIPLEDFSSLEESLASRDRYRICARRELKISDDRVVVVTVGAKFKYAALNGLDFIDVWEKILESEPRAELIVVGFHDEGRWKDASGRVGGRIRTLGAMPYAQVAKVTDAADLYVEAFSFGTTTSLLEAGLKGVPVVLAPAQSSPPYATDGIALDDVVERQADIQEYMRWVKVLLRNPGAREDLGAKLRRSIAQHHCVPGWRSHLQSAIDSLPARHSTYPEINSERTPTMIYRQWFNFSKGLARSRNIIEFTIIMLYKSNLRPILSPSIKKAHKNYRTTCDKNLISIDFLGVINRMSGKMSTFQLKWLHILIFHYRQKSLIFHIRKKFLSMMGGGAASLTEPYQEYRQIREAPAGPELVRRDRG
jgi:glycosyltransferase involved in cell wall biosynthesis